MVGRKIFDPHSAKSEPMSPQESKDQSFAALSNVRSHKSVRLLLQQLCDRAALNLSVIKKKNHGVCHTVRRLGASRVGCLGTLLGNCEATNRGRAHVLQRWPCMSIFLKSATQPVGHS